jgi:hypothetical protein
MKSDSGAGDDDMGRALRMLARSTAAYRRCAPGTDLDVGQAERLEYGTMRRPVPRLRWMSFRKRLERRDIDDVRLVREPFGAPARTSASIAAKAASAPPAGRRGDERIGLEASPATPRPAARWARRTPAEPRLNRGMEEPGTDLVTLRASSSGRLPGSGKRHRASPPFRWLGYASTFTPRQNAM